MPSEPLGDGITCRPVKAISLPDVSPQTAWLLIEEGEGWIGCCTPETRLDIARATSIHSHLPVGCLPCLVGELASFLRLLWGKVTHSESTSASQMCFHEIRWQKWARTLFLLLLTLATLRTASEMLHSSVAALQH